MKPPLLLLHGALQDSSTFDPLAERLSSTFEVHKLTFSGHGDRELDGHPFRIETFAEDVLDYLEAREISKIDVFGYSMGGYVGLYLAARRPESISRLFTLATELLWTPERAMRDIKMLDPDTIEAKVPQFARALEARHTALGWRSLLHETSQLLMDLGSAPRLAEAEFRAFSHAVRLGIGDRDTTAGVAETMQVAAWLPAGELQVFPNCLHPLERMDLDLLELSIRKFFIRPEAPGQP